jgi:hypothetical protein
MDLLFSFGFRRFRLGLFARNAWPNRVAHRIYRKPIEFSSIGQAFLSSPYAQFR